VSSQEQQRQHGEVDHHGEAQGQGHEQADVERALEAAQHEGGESATQNDGRDDDGLPRGEEGSPQRPEGLAPLLEQDAVFGEKMQGVIDGNAESDGEDA
jgi:hypothetical protein